MTTRAAERVAGGLAALGALATGSVAVLLVSGGVPLNPSAAARLPGGSVISTGLALGLVVVLPLTAAAVAGLRGSPRSGELAVLAGSVLFGGIAVQYEVMREVSWIQPAGLLYGTALVFSA